MNPPKTPSMPQSDIRNSISEILVKWHMPTRQAAISELEQLITNHTNAAVRELLGTGLYAERASYLHPQQDPKLNWPIITDPVYIIPASAVSDLVKPDFYNNRDVTNPPSIDRLGKYKDRTKEHGGE